MSLPILGDVIREVGETVRQILPDPQAQAEFDFKMATLADAADAREDALLQGQIDVNKNEASNGNIFVSGWRPAVGWLCGIVLAWTWVVAPLIGFLARLLGHDVGLPSLGTQDILQLLLGMLGLSASRTYEKVKGVANGQAPSTPVEPGVPPPSLQDQSKSKTSIPLIGSWFK